MCEKRFRVMNNDSKQLYCIESVDGEMFSIQEVVDLLNEQQATIQSLQDLCGESDGENAKLRIENKKLREELELTANTKLYSRRKLEEENKQLKKENEKLGNIHLSIDLTYSCGYGRYIADVRVVDV